MVRPDVGCHFPAFVTDIPKDCQNRPPSSFLLRRLRKAGLGLMVLRFEVTDKFADCRVLVQGTANRVHVERGHGA